MPRPISTHLRQKITEHSSDEGIVLLLTATWNGGANNLRLARYPVEVTSRGNPFLATHFEVVLPSEGHDDVPGFEVILDNTDRLLTSQVEQLSGQVATVLMEAVLVSEVEAGDGTTVEMSMKGKLRDMQYDIGQVTFRINLHDDLRIEPHPAHRFRNSDGFLTIR